MRMVKVIIKSDNIIIDVEKGVTLLQVIRKAGIDIAIECGGFGVCGKDRVIVLDGQQNLTPLTNAEFRHFSKDDISKGYRLACQAKVLGDVIILVPEEIRIKERGRRVVSQGFMQKIEVNPFIRKIEIMLPEPTLEDQRADLDRLLDTLRNVLNTDNIDVDLDLIRDLPIKLRAYNWHLNVILWGNKIISIEPIGGLTRDIYGVTVDIGTSKIVVHLVDLMNGEIRAVDFDENPQLAYGADIMSRMTYADKGPENLRELHDLVINAINNLIGRVCKKAGVPLGKIYEIVVVGNTAMHHFFLNLPTKYLGRSPFTPVVEKTLSFRARELGLRGNPGAMVTVLPNIAGFVGADAVADVLATGVIDRKDITLLIDIGTNSEIFVGNSEEIIACSAPSGPAFEGAQTRFGMKAIEGAIERVEIDGDGEVKYEVIGDVKPRGITGSAMIDIVAGLFKNGFIDRRGKLRKDLNNKRIRRYGEEWGYVIAWAHETSIDKDIVVFERDITEIMLAKAAIFSGISIAMSTRRVDVKDINEIFVAGSFGNHIDPVNAKIIGLIPDIPNDRIRFVGNTAIMGADMALLSGEARAKAEEIARRVKYIELSAHPLFQKEFYSAIYIPHRDIDKFPTVKELLKAHNYSPNA